METARNAVKNFTAKAGYRDTTVHKKEQPTVTHEHVSPTIHHEEQTAIDREIHQEHHHTTVQPIQDREVLPEKHEHDLREVEHREVQHGDRDQIKARLSSEAAQFKDARQVGETKHTREVKPTQTGEHVHHHVYETIQPVVQKETIQPTVVHSTIPVHEVHHKEPIHHTATAAPALTMADYKKQGGSLSGSKEYKEYFEGEPRISSTGLEGVANGRKQTVDNDAVTNGGTTANATATSTRGRIASTRAAAADKMTQDNVATKDSTMDSRVDSLRSAGSRTSKASSTSTGMTTDTNTSSKFADTHAGSAMDEAMDSKASPVLRTGGLNSGSTTKKPGLIDRLNPLKDSNGDGKKGILT